MKTATATLNSDVSSDLAKQIKQQQQQIGSLMVQLKSTLSAFQASQSSPFKQSSQVNSNSVIEGEGKVLRDGDAEVMVDGEGYLEVGTNPSKTNGMDKHNNKINLNQE